MIHVEITDEDMKRVAGGEKECLKSWVEFYKKQNQALLTALINGLDAIEADYLEAKRRFRDLEERMGGEAYEEDVYERMIEAKEIFEEASAAIREAKGFNE